MVLAAARRRDEGQALEPADLARRRGVSPGRLSPLPLRSDLWPLPNIEDSGTGWGYQLEGEIRLDVTQNWAVGAGVRYWYAETNGESDFINLGVTTELQDFTSERFGVFGNVTYRLNTY